MTIMIVDECDNYKLQDITDTFSFNFSTADSWARSRILSRWDAERWKLKWVRTKSNQLNVFLLPLSAYTLTILDWDAPLYSIHFIHYKIAIPHCTNYLGFIRNQQLVNNVQSMVRKKGKTQYLGE